MSLSRLASERRLEYQIFNLSVNIQPFVTPEVGQSNTIFDILDIIVRLQEIFNQQKLAFSYSPNR